MFVELKLADSVRISPAFFDRKTNIVIQDEIHARYVNKVISGHGLCICLRGIDNISESKIYHGDGAAFVRVTFRLILFKPYKDEILVGKINSCDQSSVNVTIDFFDNIIIPKENLQQPSIWDAQEKCWKWQYEDDNGTSSDLYLDKEREIVVRVTDIIFHRQKLPPLVNNNNDNTTHNKNKNITPTEQIPTMKVIATIDGQGLGLKDWWDFPS